MSSCDKSKCSSCSSKCDERDFHELPNSLSSIKKVISVISGKGGVGKSMVTSSLAVSFMKKGYKVGILDADITGPSIPKVFGINEKAQATSMGLQPIKSENGIKVMSVNLLLEDDTEPVIWRGPVIGNAVKQFWTEVIWDDIDILLIDMPPGTGDVPLTVFQTIRLDGVVIVTSPQDLVSMIVKKSYVMAEKMNINVLGIIENMSYFSCPDCKNKIYPFGEGNLNTVAKEMGIDILAKLPINPDIAKLCDEGKAENIDVSYINEAADKILNKINL